jgi:hypothetical protein
LVLRGSSLGISFVGNDKRFRFEFLFGLNNGRKVLNEDVLVALAEVTVWLTRISISRSFAGLTFGTRPSLFPLSKSETRHSFKMSAGPTPESRTNDAASAFFTHHCRVVSSRIKLNMENRDQGAD